MQCRAFSINHILTSTQNRKGGSKLALAFTKATVIRWPFPTTHNILPVLNRPSANPSNHNLYHPQHLCLLNNLITFFSLRHFILLIKLLIYSSNLPTTTQSTHLCFHLWLFLVSNLYDFGFCTLSSLYVPWAISSLPSFKQINARNCWH